MLNKILFFFLQVNNIIITDAVAFRSPTSTQSCVQYENISSDLTLTF